MPTGLGDRWRQPVLCAAVPLLAVVVGCGTLSASSSASPVTVIAQANGFILQTTLPTLHWASTEPIAITTTFTWTGAEPTKTLWTSGGGPVMFALEEVDGSRVIGPVSDDVCARKEYVRGVAASIPFVKSGGWSADDANAAFYQRFFEDPELHLPTGRWRLRVLTEGYLAECALDAPTLGLELPAILLEIR